MASMTRTRLTLGFLATAALAAPLPTASQEQTSKTRPGWPCGGRLDPAYLEMAEATGGHVYMLAPDEADAGPLIVATDQHPRTILRLAGPMNPGVHEFRVPIDSTIESVVFSISVQCLQTAHITRPSGVPLVAGDGVTDLSNFRAVRTVIVTRPEVGVWTMRAAGSGVSIVLVTARSEIAIGDIEFAAVDSSAFTRAPLAGVENVMRLGVSGRATEVRGAIVNAAFRRVAALALTAGEREGSYVTRFTPPPQGFRVVVEGKDANGVPFQRVHAPLFTPTR
jgi:hypothetical protein